MSNENPGHQYFRRATFVKSVEQLSDLPSDQGAEIAFIGRSNVGKSSVLNALCDQQGLARTSRTPGRTQHFVVFEVAPGQRLIDLPGFGYAVVDRATRAHWDKTLPLYLQQRNSLAGLVLIADIRLPLRPEELGLAQWTMTAGVPLLLLLNKADKLNRQGVVTAVRAATAALSDLGGDPASVQTFSALKREGVKALRETLDGWYEAIKKAPAS